MWENISISGQELMPYVHTSKQIIKTLRRKEVNEWGIKWATDTEKEKYS